MQYVIFQILQALGLCQALTERPVLNLNGFGLKPKPDLCPYTNIFTEI